MKKYQIIERGWDDGWSYSTTIENFEAENIAKEDAKKIIREYIEDNYQDFKRQIGTDIYFCVACDDTEIGGYWISDIIG